MTKAERLFHLTNVLRARRSAITAEQLAEKFDVSVRTIYRDIQALELSGIPIDGEPGIGYVLRPGNSIPPLMFDPDELQALLLGIKMVRAFTDEGLAKGASRAEDKILAVLPDHLKRKASLQPYVIPVLERDQPKRELHERLRHCCEHKMKLRFSYSDTHQQITLRVIWPLGIVGWGENWTLLGWCELRQDYRNFRFDRMNDIEVLQETFQTSQTLSLKHYMDNLQR